VSTDGRRVVVTGMGILSCCGKTVEENWKNVSAGIPGYDLITAFDVSEYSSRVGGEVRDFDPLEYIDRKEAKRMDRSSQLAMAASVEAMKSVEAAGYDGKDFGTLIASGIGGIQTFEQQHTNLMEKGPSKISPFFIPMMIADMSSGLVSIRYGLKGPNFTTVSACASAGHGIATSFMMIKQGYTRGVLTGGTEGTISPMALGGFCSMKALSTRNDDPKGASRPFDVGRDGFVMAEGSGIVILEDLDHARARGAAIYAELVGIGMTGDAYHITSPAPGGVGAVESMRMAIRDAGIEPGQIDYVNAHGTSTQYNDKSEAEAIRTVFGAGGGPYVSSTKSCSGHMLGAAAGFEFIMCVKALQEKTIPPTANLDEIDPECRLNHVQKKAIGKDLEYVLSNSFGFGGHNVSLLLKRFEQ
jgi:3-oxoacyl-[acyl-carrier-protein] synthase II